MTVENGLNRLPLATVVLTLNEERHLPECLASVAGLGERVLVIDSGSRDDTVRIAGQLGADVIERPFSGYASQRNAALALVDQPWVLFLDADERLTRGSRAEIARVISEAGADVAGFGIPRRNEMFGWQLRGGGWWPDHQVRLLRRGRAHYQVGQEVHEVVELNGRRVDLDTPMIHLNYHSWTEFRAKQRRYSRMRATVLLSQGRVPRRRTYLGQPAREFWRRYVQLDGHRDGLLGLQLALAMAWYEFRTWRQTRRLLRERALGASGQADRARSGEQEVDAVPPAGDLDLSVIIVSYNVRELLLACLASIEASLSSSDLKAEIIVVDNASPDASADAVRRRFPQVRLIENASNTGFAAANNQGIRASRGRCVALLNPDTTIVGDAFGVLVRRLACQPDIGVVGPRLVYADGTTQSTRRRFPTLLTGLLESTLVQDYWHDNAVLRRYYVKDRSDELEQDVDWLVGACLVVRREVFARAGLFDERFFMYSEEVEWCRRVHDHGWRIVYLPAATVVHYEGRSSQQNLPARQINFDTSKVLLFEELHGRAAARVLRSFLLTTYLLRVFIEGGKGLLGHKSSLRRERIALYLRVFRSGLKRRSRS